MARHSFTLAPGKKFKLDTFDPSYRGKFDSKKDALKPLADNLERLRELQEKLYASGDKALLIVLQAMDAAGKDGTIKHVMGAFNPQGVRVASFKAPTPRELAQDFLWRVHRHAPRRGLVGIFNRSHYEDVLVVRVKGFVPKRIWKERYEHIRNFEKLLAASGVSIVKFFLHISPEEQEERFLERRDTPEKQWKFNPGDLEDRKLWSHYMAAYEDALSECNTPWAPWYVIPANRKWYRNLAISEILIKTLERMKLKFPDPPQDIEGYEIPAAG